MRSFWRPVRILVGLLAIPAIYTPACSHDEHAAAVDFSFEGDTNDEALQQLLDAPAKIDAARSPVFVTPKAEAKLSAATPATFQWSSTTTAFAPRAVRRDIVSISAWPLGVERAAHAHGPPVNGRAYLLVLSVPGNDKLVRLFTTKTTYTPDRLAWDMLRSAGDRITANLTSASYDNNNLTRDGGPYATPSVTFTIE